MNDALRAQALFGGSEVVAHVRLTLDPADVARDALFEPDARRVPGGARERRVGDEVAHLAGAELAARDRLDPNFERVGDDLGDAAHARCLRASDVDGETVESVGRRG